MGWQPGKTATVSDFGAVQSNRPSPASFPGTMPLPLDVVTYGPDIPDESAFRLLGTGEGRRILVLGLGRGHVAVTLALQGARVICVDTNIENIEAARVLADANEVKLDLHHGDLAELAFVRADTIDVALSVYELGRIDDLDRVLRQVNRVLHTGSHFVCSFPHPAYVALDESVPGSVRFNRAYTDRSPRTAGDATVYPRSIADVFSSFGRANFRVDALLEPIGEKSTQPSPFWAEAMRAVPPTLIMRGKKEGV